tara:strand:+ start:1274 stop:1705 length:432 start_codon:yes stop_codon:yes gene_type:complete
MNENKMKKIRVRFPNLVTGNMVVGECTKQVMKFPEIQDINNRLYSEMFTSGGSGKAEVRQRIEGFNCTWINHEGGMGKYVDAQFTFGSAEEKKVMKIIEKFGGFVVDVRKDLVQMGQRETNNTTLGKEIDFERVNEILGARSF